MPLIVSSKPQFSVMARWPTTLYSCFNRISRRYWWWRLGLGKSLNTCAPSQCLGWLVQISSQPARPKAPARRLGSMARACVADGSKNVGLYNAANQNPKNSERDAHRLFAKYWLSLKVTISFIEVPPENDGIFNSVPFYKARWFCRGKCYRAKFRTQKLLDPCCWWIYKPCYAEI